MSQLHYMLLSGLTGLISGWLLSIPVGPVNLTIMNEGAQRGFKWAVLIGLGASVMEVIYCSLAFTGFASFFSAGYVKAIMELGSEAGGVAQPKAMKNVMRVMAVAMVPLTMNFPSVRRDFL